jgi:outer membrane protein OmpA-like peptidoglycan-associated protein
MVFATVLVASLGLAATASADDHLRGVVAGRSSDGLLLVQTEDAQTIAVILADQTKIRRTDGARTRRTSSAMLVPGLRVHIRGRYNGSRQFIADRVEAKRSDMKTAMSIQAGIAATDQRSLLNQQRIEQHSDALQQQGASIDRQGQQLERQRGQIAANAEKIVATSGVLEATNARIGNLDDYTVVDTVTVFFANGRASIAPKYRKQLKDLAERARGTAASVVQVQGFASRVGSEARNQELSMKRADAVTALLQQNGIAPTTVVVPAAMGTTQQVGSNKTAKGQAENRRAVVMVLQNKGIAAR